MNQPTPAIVAQDAVRRLPRLALLLFCLAYSLPGFFGREPWKSADMTAFGYMLELARGHSAWLSPQLAGISPEVDALAPYWLGAWAIQWAPSWMAPDLAARLPFLLLLLLTLAATWYSIYFIARSPQAQPVAFAFGGEASLSDYARAMGDGGLLALIGCLGLAQLAHETTPALTQVCFGAVAFCALAALPYRQVQASIGLMAGLAGMALSGAPAMACLFGLGAALADRSDNQVHDDQKISVTRRVIIVLVCSALVAALSTWLGLWRWRIDVSTLGRSDWHSLGRLLLWFTWPVWPLMLWTLWRWRRQIRNRHIALPLWLVVVSVGTTLLTPSSERSLMVGLPAMSALAAFALPTLRRSVAALIDWFTLLFFSGSAFVIWVVWISMQTGVPRQPAANVSRLAPGFEASFSALPFAVAIAATLAWAWLVKWRVGRHRAAIWKSLVLPAGGVALSWLLLMTLWLPLLDFARSYGPLVRIVARQVDDPGCVQFHGLTRGQIAAFQFHGKFVLHPATTKAQCRWLIVDADAQSSLAQAVDLGQWTLQATVRRPSDNNEDVLLYKRAAY